MLIPLERMRVGINSESASHTHTPGPDREKRHEHEQGDRDQPSIAGLGTGLIRAFSIFSGALREASRSPNGLEKKAMTLFAGTQRVAGDLDRLGGRIIGTHCLAGRPEISVRINHDQRSRRDRLAELPRRVSSFAANSCVVEQRESLVGA